MQRTLLALGLTIAVITAAVAYRPDPPKDFSGASLEPLPPAQTGPQFWKGNLHTHSLWSDGDDFPEMIADWYKRNNYHFLALTEHNVIAEGDRWIDATGNATREFAVQKYLARFGPGWVERRETKGKTQVRLKPLREFKAMLDEPGRFHMIPGEEITHRYMKQPIHMNAINLRDVIKPVDGKNVSETIALNLRSAADQAQRTNWPMVTFVNHPNFQWGLTAEEMLAADGLKFYEIFNGHSGVNNYGDETHASCERIWDILLAHRLGKLQQPVVYGVATDDSHRYHEFGLGKINPGRGWVMVRAPYLSAEAMVNSMHAGDFYCSSGVSLARLERNPAGIQIDIQTEPGIEYETEFIATMKDAPLDSEPVLGPNGQPLPVTRKYSPEIGKVVQRVAGPKAQYEFTGKELYVRAKITSTKPHPNPYAQGDVEVAWTQPMLH
jgi:hypothetical protein